MTSTTPTPTRITEVVTHQHPDLDAILSIHLLAEHGRDQFPGVEEASYTFVSANSLPGGKTAEQLEAEGVLAVDTGGGRFDTHPVEGEANEDKWDTCAAQLVAEALGVDKAPAYRFLLPYTLNHDARGQSLTSREATHHLLAPHGLIEGLHRYLEDDATVVEVMRKMLAGLAAAGEEDELAPDETAKRFDRTLTRFLESGDFGDPSHIRKEMPEWPVEGECHQLARQRGWEVRRDLEKLLKEAAWLLANTANALPSVELERRVLLPAALNGLAKLYGEESEYYTKAVFPLFHAAVQREADWFSAIDDVERSAKVVRGRGISLVAIASRNGLSIKAARYRRGANAVFYYDPGPGNVTLQSGQKKDGSPILNLTRIAGRLRAAELVRRKGNGPKPPKNINDVGLVAGWFLHPSLKLLNRGSPKAQDVESSALSWPELIEMVRTDLRPEEKMPDWFCPPDRCLEAKCTFYPLRLANCHQHRKNLRETPQKGTLGDLFAEKLEKAKKKDRK